VGVIGRQAGRGFRRRAVDNAEPSLALTPVQSATAVTYKAEDGVDRKEGHYYERRGGRKQSVFGHRSRRSA